jgi:hypothetical protein
MSDLELPAPLAAPPSPNPNDIIASTWGDWVHTEVLNRRILAYAETTTNQGGIGSTGTDVTGLSFTVTTLANRYYELSAGLYVTASVANSLLVGSLWVDGAQQAASGSASGAANYGITVALRRIFKALAAGSHTFKVQLFCTLAATATVQAAPTNPAFLTLRDLGPLAF